MTPQEEIDSLKLRLAALMTPAPGQPVVVQPPPDVMNTVRTIAVLVSVFLSTIAAGTGTLGVYHQQTEPKPPVVAPVVAPAPPAAVIVTPPVPAPVAPVPDPNAARLTALEDQLKILTGQLETLTKKKQPSP